MRTPSAPFEPLHLRGESITLDTSGKVLVLPSGNSAVLPSFNEYTLNSNRLSIAESPFGGLKGSGSPDYCPGTLYTPTDGVYLTDVAGNNSTKTLTAGMLKGVSGLTVDTTAHTITEEFIIANTGESNNPTVIDACDSADGWASAMGTGEITSVDGSVVFTGTTNVSGYMMIKKSFNSNLSDKYFIIIRLKCSASSNLYLRLGEVGNSVRWFGTRFPVVANTYTTFVLPIKAPAGATGVNPGQIEGSLDFTNITQLAVGVHSAGNSVACAITTDYILTDTEKSAYIELQTPNNLAPQSFSIQTHNGTAYNPACRVDSLDGAYSNVSQASANCTMADCTLLDHVYGAGLGRAVYPKGVSGATVNGSIGAMTYSANQGTSKRIGLMVSLPPSDGGRTNFNKIRLRTILTYAPDVDDNYSASYDFADSTTASYGLQNLSKPWIALYDPTTSEVDFYLFTHRPKNLTYKRDESGTIYELSLYPGNGQIYHGQIDYADLTADTDSNDIPNCLEASLEGSLTKFLQGYGMVI